MVLCMNFDVRVVRKLAVVLGARGRRVAASFGKTERVRRVFRDAVVGIHVGWPVEIVVAIVIEKAGVVIPRVEIGDAIVFAHELDFGHLDIPFAKVN